jgi:nitrite reductase (NO-forming)
MRTFLLFTTVCAMFGYLSPVTAEQGGDKGVTYRPHVTFTLRTDIGEGCGRSQPHLQLPRHWRGLR